MPSGPRQPFQSSDRRLPRLRRIRQSARSGAPFRSPGLERAHLSGEPEVKSHRCQASKRRNAWCRINSYSTWQHRFAARRSGNRSSCLLSRSRRSPLICPLLAFVLKAPNAYVYGGPQGGAHRGFCAPRMLIPSAASANPADSPTENSASVQPPSGTNRNDHVWDALSTNSRSPAGSSKSRIGCAPARSESNKPNLRSLIAERRRRGFSTSRKNGNSQAPGLLCRLRQNSFPSISAFYSAQQANLSRFARLLAGTISSTPKFGGFLNRPFEPVKFDDSQQQSRFHRRRLHWKCVPPNGFTSSRPTLSVRASHTASPSLNS